MESVRYRVLLTTDEGIRLNSGELISNGSRAAFRYEQPFARSGQGLPLDPVNLDIRQGTHETDRVLFGVFEDSLPDGWGRSLIARALGLSHAQQSPHLLLQYLDDRSIGALAYERIGERPILPASNENIHSLAELASAAMAFEAGELQDDAMLQRLFRSAGSSGGAHPKVTVTGDDGRLKLVKLPSIRDIFDVVGLEASCLELARMAGMPVPEFVVLEAGGIKMLCLDRFDRTDSGCRHMISMQSLLNASGYYHASYVQMADVLRMVSRYPDGDLQALFRQMIFNALIGNTDDHLKNFSMYYLDGYCLTPAYDLLPDVNQRGVHTLSFSDNDVGPRREEATGILAARFKIGAKTAAGIVDEVVEIVAANWSSVCAANEVPKAQVERFAGYIDRQRQKLSA